MVWCRLDADRAGKAVQLGLDDIALLVRSDHLPDLQVRRAEQSDVPPERYRALTDWLLGQTLDNIPVTFTEIEDAPGLPLPGRARVDTAYWRRARTELANAVAAGRCRATGVQLTEERLVLTRLVAGDDA